MCRWLGLPAAGKTISSILNEHKIRVFTDLEHRRDVSLNEMRE